MDPGRRGALGLDGVNFFTAGVQTAFGAFTAVYLVKNQWPAQDIGLALTITTLSSLVSQIPAGAYIDSVQDKRRAVLAGIVGVGVAALLLCVTAERFAVFFALALQGLASSFIAPAIAAISLALVGQAGLSERVGRNARFASIGNGLAAGVMGFAGARLPSGSVFPVAVALTLPAVLSLLLISRGAAADATPFQPAELRARAETTWRGMKNLLLDRRLSIFCGCVLLFFAASAAIGPGIAGQVTKRRPDTATLIVAATILLPQGIVAAISPWVGRLAETFGRRPMLLLGWGLLPIQALVYVVVPDREGLVLCYLLNAVSGAVFGVMVTVVAADLTRDTGWFNLTLGTLGVATSIGASLSTFFGGLVAAAFGTSVAAIGLALVGICALLVVWLCMPETRADNAAKTPRPAPSEVAAQATGCPPAR